MELDEEHAGTTDFIDILAEGQDDQVDRGVTIANMSLLGKSDISKDKENHMSPKISHRSVEYKNSNFLLPGPFL